MTRIKILTGVLLAIAAMVSSVGAQENADRYDFVLRDVLSRAKMEGTRVPAVSQNPAVTTNVRIAESSSNGGAIVQVLAVEMPARSSDYYFQPDAAVILPQLSESPDLSVFATTNSYPGKFMFSSAFERWNMPPTGDFSSVPNSEGMCDEWQTFFPCESCCRDLGLNPWAWRKVRPNCPKCHGSRCEPCRLSR